MNPLAPLLAFLHGVADLVGAKLTDLARWLIELVAGCGWESPTEVP